ncbi:methyltransferase [Microbacterium sp. VKM Ac-2923]|uniref:RraA family protein n=1 Tax=Microbacterium sp. VKM Ac-2923 TaxID=2929476 RepID=UPI001FB1C47E|nr:methyltransferase [Microbacterium sp. VKM Ac-2923]MCJ1708557.1 methyltransferase [Microbacterium sp. VKM Ac-2923]
MTSAVATAVIERAPLSASERERLAPLAASAVVDSMQRLGSPDAGISPTWAGARLVGPALTVLTAAGDNQIVHAALDVVQPGEVIVLNGFGDTTRALIGDLIAERALSLGVAGFVVDGCVRDVDAIRELGLPVFARGVTPAGPYKNGPGVIGGAVAIGGVAVLTGDVVVADADGVVFIPRAQLDTIVDLAEQKLESEARKRASIRASVI